jgi:hypothetical protein
MTDEIILVSSWVNHPETLKLHRDLWVAAFPEEKVRYVVYIDAKDFRDPSNFNNASMRTNLINECKDNNIEYNLVREDLHYSRHTVIPNCKDKDANTPSARDVLVCHLAWNELVLNMPTTQRIGFIQPDLFPYRKIIWKSLTRDSEFYYKAQVRDDLTYAWNGLCFFTMYTWDYFLKSIVDFQDGFQKGVFTDSGGGLWKLLDALDKSKRFAWTGQNSLQWSSEDEHPEMPFWVMEYIRNDPRNESVAGDVVLYFSEIMDGRFLHLRAGCNWDGVGKDIHDKRYSTFLKHLNAAIEDDTVFLD